jgi:HEPN domain-containing protein
MKKSILAALMLCIFGAAVFCQSAVEVTAVTDKTSAKLGDVIRYTISVKRQGDLSQSPSLSLPSFEGFRVAGSYSNNSMSIINGAAAASTDQIVDLMAVKSGEVTIDPAKVKFYNTSTKQYETIATKAITITVTQGGRRSAAPTPTIIVPAATPDIRSIKMSVSISFMDLLPYIILAALFIAAVYFGAKKLFGKKEEKAVAPAEDDFRKEALKKLKKAQEILKSGDVKQYYYSLYEAVRFFISGKYSNTFEELTTQEIIRKLAEINAGEGEIKPVYEFMRDCDLVKFADYRPNDSEAEEVYSKAEKIINR